jgi:hypothetical protein
MLCDLEQIDHTQEARLTRQSRSDIRKPMGVIESISISPSSMR